MASKSKKKTIASTRKKVKEENKENENKLDEKNKKAKTEKKEGKKVSKFFQKKEKKEEKTAAEKPIVQEKEKIEKSPKKSLFTRIFHRTKDKKLKEKSDFSSDLDFEEAAKAIEALGLEENRRSNLIEQKKYKRKFGAFRIRRQKIQAVFLVLIGLFALVYIGTLLYVRFFRAQPIAEIIPQENGIGFLEININSSDTQVQQLFNLLKKYPQYTQNSLTFALEKAFVLNSKKDLEPWLGREIGLSLLSDNKSSASGQIKPLLFIETRDQNKTIDFIKNWTTSENNELLSGQYLNKYKIYTFKKNPDFNFVFINSYLVFSTEDSLLKQYLTALENGKTLAQEPSYQKVSNNLPHGGFAYGYIDYRKLLSSLKNNKAFISEKNRYLHLITPFFNSYNAAGISFFSEKQNIVFQTYTSIEKTESSTQAKPWSNNKKYEGKLLNLADSNALILAGGRDLSSELSKIDTIQENSLIDNIKSYYFGNSISLNEDIYPLLNKEYFLEIGGSIDKPYYTFALQLDNAGSNSIIEKLIAAFKKTGGDFSSKINNVTLPDGTTGQEIISDPTQIVETTLDYGNSKITKLKLGRSGYNLFLIVTDNKLLISTEQSALERMIDRNNGKLNTGLLAMANFEESIKPLLNSSDELISLQIGAITSYLGLNDNIILKPYLLPFGQLTVTRNSFDDGISSIYTLEII